MPSDEYFEWKDEEEKLNDLADDGYPKRGYNFATGELASDDKQKTEQPFPIEIGNNGKRYMKTNGTYPKPPKAPKASKKNKAAANAQGVFLDPVIDDLLGD